MSDLDVFTEMLTRAGIDHHRDEKRAKDVSDGHKERIGACIVTEDGYPGFYTEFHFRPDGRLRSIESYE